VLVEPALGGAASSLPSDLLSSEAGPSRSVYGARVHPCQRPLPRAIEEVWLAALADAAIDPNDALLYVIDGEEGSKGYAARFLFRHREVRPEDEQDEVHPLLAEMNGDDCIDAYRVYVFESRSLEGAAALVRHELEHARQYDRFGQDLMDLYELAGDVIGERVVGLRGGAFLYQVIPVEFDANAAAAAFVRRRFGADRINALLDDGDKDGAAFRSLVGPPDLNTLPERMLRFFATVPDLCQRVADRRGFSFARLIDVHWRGSGDVYERLLTDDALKLPR
jgi:hypothetical protein